MLQTAVPWRIRQNFSFSMTAGLEAGILSDVAKEVEWPLTGARMSIKHRPRPESNPGSFCWISARRLREEPVPGWTPSPTKINAESYEDKKTAEFINLNFLPVKAHIKERAAWFHRFDAVWTPTVLLLHNEGKERVRLEGYLPNEDFLAALESGLSRIAFVHKNYPHGERWYNDVVAGFGHSHWAAEAMYWRAVAARYKAANGLTVLGKVAGELRRVYPTSVWTVKAVPWLPTESEKEVA
jgi:hypothetical protein